MARPASALRARPAAAALHRLTDLAHAELRQRMVFEGCKWDPQVGDVEVVGRQVLVLPPEDVATLTAAAEALAAESLRLERALLERPDLHALIGIPRALRDPLRAARERPATDDLRVMRFDFHPTDAGWVVSEVNCDVPGGFAEAGAMPRIVAQLSGLGAPGPDPAQALADGLQRRSAPGARVALVHATSFSDDRQVMEHLGQALSARGLRPIYAAPDHLRWATGSARCIAGGAEGEVAAVVRFFPTEWLPSLSAACGWPAMFGSAVQQCNPPGAVLVQSKRAMLSVPALGLELPAWRRWSPGAREPDLRGLFDDRLVLKSAWGRVGEGVAIRGCTDSRELLRMRVGATLERRQWVMQDRFDSAPLGSTDGPLHLCVGVFVIDGRAAGFYGRAALAPRIDKHAFDVAVLCG